MKRLVHVRRCPRARSAPRPRRRRGPHPSPRRGARPARRASTSPALAVVIGVLEVEPHGACGEQAADELLGLQPVAGLHVGRHGHVHGRRDAPHGARTSRPPGSSPRPGSPSDAVDRRAGGGHRRVAEPRHEARRSHVPDVGENEQLLPQVERSQASAWAESRDRSGPMLRTQSVEGRRARPSSRRLNATSRASTATTAARTSHGETPLPESSRSRSTTMPVGLSGLRGARHPCAPRLRGAPAPPPIPCPAGVLRFRAGCARGRLLLLLRGRGRRAGWRRRELGRLRLRRAGHAPRSAAHARRSAISACAVTHTGVWVLDVEYATLPSPRWRRRRYASARLTCAAGRLHGHEALHRVGRGLRVGVAAGLLGEAAVAVLPAAQVGHRAPRRARRGRVPSPRAPGAWRRSCRCRSAWSAPRRSRRPRSAIRRARRSCRRPRSRRPTCSARIPKAV